MDMHFEEITHELNVMLPLIYMWEIKNGDGKLLGCYVGKAETGARRPRRHYARNVANFLNGKPYRKHNPIGYRKVHIALANAEKSGFCITLFSYAMFNPMKILTLLSNGIFMIKTAKVPNPGN